MPGTLVPAELAHARDSVADACREATLRVRGRAVERRARAEERAAAAVAEAVGTITTAAGLAHARPDPDRRTVVTGRVEVRRHTPATAGLEVPLLVPVGRGGGACVVAGEDGLPDVLSLLQALVLGAGVGGTEREPGLVVVNPRGRMLPPSVGRLAGLRMARDARPALVEALAVRRGGAADGGVPSPGVTPRRPPSAESGRLRVRPPAHLVVLDFPHGMGLAGRRLVRDAVAGVDGTPSPLLVHVAPDGPDVDELHRRFHVPRCGVPMPAGPCELWWRRGRWTWVQQPGLVVRTDRGPQAAPGNAVAPGPHEGVLPARELGPGRGYEEGLRGLVAAAEQFDADLGAIRKRERAALDAVARRRRHALDDLLRRARSQRAGGSARRGERDRGPPRGLGARPPGRAATRPSVYPVGPSEPRAT